MKTFLIIVVGLVFSKLLLKALFPYTNRAFENMVKESKIVKPFIAYYNYCKIWW